jgi:hypothetical protein
LRRPFGLINAKPAIFIAATTVALLSRSGFIRGNGNRLALRLQNLDLAKFRYYLLHRKFFLGHLISPIQVDTFTPPHSEKTSLIKGKEVKNLSLTNIRICGV